MDAILLGIDGMEPSLIREWREDLPTIASLADDGVETEIRSSDPPFTVPAWPTLYTGKQGGKHGAFTFEKRVDESYEYIPINYSDVHAQSLWEILDNQGISCGVVNVPLTYPPTKLDHGYVVSGWPAPRNDSICSDQDILNKIENISGTYEVNPYPLTFDLKEVEKEKIASDICDGLSMRNEAFSQLLSTTNVDLFFGVYMGVDVASHSLSWDRGLLKKVYMHQDRLLEDLLDTVDDDTDIILLSDHGHAQQSKHSFHVNEWLRQRGDLKIKQSRGSTQFLRKLGATQELYASLRLKLGLGKLHERLPSPVLNALKRFVPREEGTVDFDEIDVDWGETTAYAPVQNEIYLNRTDREPQGVVPSEERTDVTDDIVSGLRSLRHPERDEPLISNIYRGEEIFDGPYADDGPDVILVADDMACNVSKGFNDDELFSKLKWGEHRQYGTFLAAGPSIATDAELGTPTLMDVLPTVFAILDATIPSDVDGNVVSDFLETQPEVQYGGSSQKGSSTETYSAEESEEVKEQLQGLGYLE